tara:strand:- start:243 stop:1112 length:870 start_codon:yes stop_codon:yes gene_type:complete
MGWWMPVAGAAAGYLIDRKMGGNGLSGAMMGGSLGYGGMGSGGTAAADAGGKGVTAMESASSANSLGGGAALMGGTSTAVGTGATTGATTGILGSSTNAIPSYDIGMEGVKANIGGFTAPVEQSLVNANAYQPLNGGIAPDMSFKQSYINTTPEQGMANLGTPQRPNLNEYPTIMGGEGSSVGIDTTSRDVSGNYETLATSPDFNNITKSSPEELANAQGGYDKPLYEKAFDSVMGFAQENPIALATLGMTALGGSSSASPQQVTQSAGKIAQQAYNPNKERILNIRRA